MLESHKGYKKSMRQFQQHTPRLNLKRLFRIIIGCMNKDDWLEVEEIERCNDFLGVALSSGIGDDFDHFIVILPGAFDSDQ